MASEPVFELVLESDDIGRVELKLDNKRAERYRQVEALGASGELAAGIGAEFREIVATPCSKKAWCLAVSSGVNPALITRTQPSGIRSCVLDSSTATWQLPRDVQQAWSWLSDVDERSMHRFIDKRLRSFVDALFEILDETELPSAV